VAKPKIAIVGELRYSEGDGLQGSAPSLSAAFLKDARRFGVLRYLQYAHDKKWLEILSNAYEWPGVFHINQKARKEEKEAYAKRLHSEPSYKQAAKRDKGQCVKCGARERLEFDHIIPLALGVSNTERNIQLLCEACNRSKGSTI
jgi:HNH endonuclease